MNYFKITIIIFFVISYLSPSAAQTNDYIINSTLTNYQGYQWLGELCRLGPRLSGSPNSLKVIHWAEQKMKDLGYDKVWLQPVNVPYWVRGNVEEAWLSKSKYHSGRPLSIAALGGSIGTKLLSGQVVEVSSFDQLQQDSSHIKGKIVFFNRPFDQTRINTFAAYGGAVNQRTQGAIEAARAGGIAAIVRSVTSLHDNVPHVGVMYYREGVKKIPAVAIGTEDADFLSRILKKDPGTEVSLKLSCKNRPDTVSYNIIGDVLGMVHPDEVILIGGHLDAWDKGHGAHDDGAGCMQALEVPILLKNAQNPPKRTIRCVLFIDEEQRQSGAKAYAAYIDTCQEKHIAAIESDRGAFSPRGFSVETDSNQLAQMQNWLPELRRTNIEWIRRGGSGANIGKLKKIPLRIGFVPDIQRYFDYHHSANDTYDKVHPREMQLGTAAMALITHFISENGLQTSH